MIRVAIVPCLDIEACVLALLYLHIKLVWWGNSPRDTQGSSTHTQQHQVSCNCNYVRSLFHSIVPFHIFQSNDQRRPDWSLWHQYVIYYLSLDEKEIDVIIWALHGMYFFTAATLNVLHVVWTLEGMLTYTPQSLGIYILQRQSKITHQL